LFAVHDNVAPHVVVPQSISTKAMASAQLIWRLGLDEMFPVLTLLFSFRIHGHTLPEKPISLMHESVSGWSADAVARGETFVSYITDVQ
jgi:hypothetical protein